MSIDIVVPVLGESVSEASIAKWHKKQGDAVKTDELLLELETEKVTLEVNALADGVLSKINKNEGDTVKVGEIVGVIEGLVIPVTTVTQNVNSSVDATLASSSVNLNPNSNSAKINPASAMPPSVQKLVVENNLLAQNIIGTGKDGRITKGDALKELATKNATMQPPALTVEKLSVNKIDEERSVEIVKMSRLRKTIAQRLKDSQNTAAILTTFNEIDMSSVIALRQRYKEEFEKKHNVKLGFMSFFVKATIAALKLIPAVNAEINEDNIIYKNYYDIGVAVGTEQGLVVPVLKNCDLLSFSDIEKSIASLGKRAREGKLAMADLAGGTFTISNGGVYGSLLSTPIINPPQSGILGLHKTEERPIAVNGKVEIRPMMYVALSYDHRIIDGKEAVTFLVKIKEAIENPERLLLNI